MDTDTRWDKPRVTAHTSERRTLRRDRCIQVQPLPIYINDTDDSDATSLSCCLYDFR